jgi:hypothetical protein
VEQLLRLCGDERSDVSEAAREGLTDGLANQPEHTSHVISAIHSGTCPPGALLAVLALPSEQLARKHTALLDLLSSPVVEVREQMLSAIADGSWLQPDDALLAAELAVSDEDPAVRDRAVTTCRHLYERRATSTRRT